MHIHVVFTQAKNRSRPWLLALWALLACLVVAQNSQRLMSEAAVDQVTAQFGEKGRTLFMGWGEFVLEQLKAHKQQTERNTLEQVNRYFNQRIRFVSDQEHWQKEDYWATPLESLVTQGGDCEDYVIAKYFSLIQSGVSQEKLRITYVKAIRLNQAHMVLAYYATPKSDPLILDNLNPQIVKASKRRDLVPVYSFNDLGLWLERQHGSIKVGSAGQLSMWMDVLLRMQEQGLGPWAQLPSVVDQ